MDQQDLLDLKDKIDQAKEKAAELKGQRQGLIKELKDDWQCSTIVQGEQKIKLMDDEVVKLNDQIKKGMEELEEKYNV